MFDPDPPPSSAPVACCTDAIPIAQHARWLEVVQRVYARACQLVELDAGYALRLPGDADTLMLAAEHIMWDRRCCAFLRWELRVEPEGGPLWLSMTGSAAAKAMLRTTFETTDLLPLALAEGAGFAVHRREPVTAATFPSTAHRVCQRD